MSNTVVASGQQIYDAAIEGAKRGYNRSTDDYTKYSSLISNFYNALLNSIRNKSERNRIRKNTNNDWRQAKFPLELAMFHDHIRGQLSETHARVYFADFPAKVFDIPLDHWQFFEYQSKRVA